MENVDFMRYSSRYLAGCRNRIKSMTLPRQSETGVYTPKSPNFFPFEEGKMTRKHQIWGWLPYFQMTPFEISAGFKTLKIIDCRNVDGLVLGHARIGLGCMKWPKVALLNSSFGKDIIRCGAMAFRNSPTATSGPWRLMKAHWSFVLAWGL